MKTTFCSIALSAAFVILSGYFAAAAPPEFQRLQEGVPVLGKLVHPNDVIEKPGEIAIDIPNSKLYIADPEKHRIVRFGLGADLTSPIRAEAVFGQPTFQQTVTAASANRDSLSGPSGMCVDKDGRLWVADTGNNRVLWYNQAWERQSGPAADGVLGQVNFTAASSGTSSNKMSGPSGLAISGAGRLYVSDTVNNRILCFNNAAGLANGVAANAVLGQPGFTTTAPACTQTNMSAPKGIAVETWGGTSNPYTFLWVADTNNNRILRFDHPPSLANGAPAAGVFGHSNFTTVGGGVTASKLNKPQRVAVHMGNLWVADTSNNRVLRFNVAPGKPNGADADLVLGQPGFPIVEAGEGAAGLAWTSGLALDASGRLFVSDTMNSRVVVHHKTATKTNGAEADAVIGADSLVPDLSRNFNPFTFAIDPLTGKVFVADMQRNRVLRFADHRSIAAGAAAEMVFGQSSLHTTVATGGQAGMRDPSGVWVDHAGRLWVADSGNHRILRFNNASSRSTGVGADGVLGQATFMDDQPDVSNKRMNRPIYVCGDSAGRIWVSDFMNNRVLRFDNASQRPNGIAANGVLGQPNFDMSDPGCTAGTVNGPFGLSVDSTGRLWVCDSVNNRVLRFDLAAGKANGAAASGVLGQSSFEENDLRSSSDGMQMPSAVSTDPHGRLWVSDFANRRLLRFDQPTALATGMHASDLMGQEDWGMTNGGYSLSRPYVSSMFHAADGTLWVADYTNIGNSLGSILRFEPPSNEPVICGINNEGRFHFTFSTIPSQSYRIQKSTDLKTWTDIDTISAIGVRTQWIAPQAASGKRFYRAYKYLASF